MTRFIYRDEKMREEITYCVSDLAWGAIKAWQQADEDRPELSADAVREATDDYLFEIGEYPDCIALIDMAVAEILKRLDRTSASIYL